MLFLAVVHFLERQIFLVQSKTNSEKMSSWERLVGTVSGVYILFVKADKEILDIISREKDFLQYSDLPFVDFLHSPGFSKEIF